MSAPLPISVGAASHDARVGPSDVTWRTVYSADGATPYDATRLVRIDLARPVAATLDADASPGVTAVMVGDTITGFVVDTARVPAYAVALTLHAPRAHDGGGEILAPPFARGSGVQRVQVAGDDDLRFAPDGAALERHVGYWSVSAVDESDKARCDERLPGHLAIGDAPIYVGHAGTPPVLHGHLSTATDRARGSAIGVTLVSVIVVATLAWAYRRLTGRARVEQAEAILREEFERGGA